VVLIEVTKRDILRGRRQATDACPVARALKRALGLECEPSVEEGRIRVFGRCYKAPRSVTRFVRRFDKLGHAQVQPFRFRLEISSDALATTET
jgi:hypothetical protein